MVRLSGDLLGPCFVMDGHGLARRAFLAGVGNIRLSRWRFLLVAI